MRCLCCPRARPTRGNLGASCLFLFFCSHSVKFAKLLSIVLSTWFTAAGFIHLVSIWSQSLSSLQSPCGVLLSTPFQPSMRLLSTPTFLPSMWLTQATSLSFLPLSMSKACSWGKASSIPVVDARAKTHHSVLILNSIRSWVTCLLSLTR